MSDIRGIHKVVARRVVRSATRLASWVRPQSRAPGETPRMWRVWISAPILVAAASGLAYLIYVQLRSAAPLVALPGQPPAVNTLEVVKTTISVAAFVGAVLAGIYAYRKQRLTEAESLRAD